MKITKTRVVWTEFKSEEKSCWLFATIVPVILAYTNVAYLVGVIEEEYYAAPIYGVNVQSKKASVCCSSVHINCAWPNTLFTTQDHLLKIKCLGKIILIW